MKKRGSLLVADMLLVAGLLGGSLTVPGTAQETPAKPIKCNQYTVDSEKNRVSFNNPRIYIMIPSKAERDRLRGEGSPGQVFIMKDCDTPDETATLKVYPEPADATATPSEEIFSATPVLVLAEQNGWVQVKGRTKMWEGRGWIKLNDKTVVVKY
jgi:hypothetical protein